MPHQLAGAARSSCGCHARSLHLATRHCTLSTELSARAPYPLKLVGERSSMVIMRDARRHRS